MAKKYQDIFSKNPGLKDKSLMQHEEIKKKITVLSELESLIPPLSNEEFVQLEKNILEEGCREALLYWEREKGEYVLIDGHNRYNICRKHQLDFKVHAVAFADLKEAKDYMIGNQLGRRNLTPEQASYLRGLRYNNEKQEKGKYDRKQKSQNGPYDKKPTSEKLAGEYKVSKNTIKRDAAYASGLNAIGKVNPDLKKQILSGTIKANKTQISALANMESSALKEIETLEDIYDSVKKKAAVDIPEATKITQKEKKAQIRVLKEELITLGELLDAEDPSTIDVCESIAKRARKLKKLLG